MPVNSKNPLWTQPVYSAGGGLDHLGLGSVVTDRILPKLSPGINVLTAHPRYWSFYAFVLDEFWQRGENLNSTKAMKKFFRSKEMIFSVAGHLCENKEHRASQSPIGSNLVGPEVKRQPKNYRADFDYMKSRGGGYGLYYSTVMQTMGVVRLADPSVDLAIDAVTPTLGKDMAEAFRESISGTRYWKKYFNSEEVPAEVVKEYADAACMCRLRDNTPDREILVDAFLHGGLESSANARRASLQMMLEVANQSKGFALEQNDFRRLVLYGSTYDSTTDAPTARLVIPDALLGTARGWRLSQLREMFNYSLNGMWAAFHDWGMSQNGDYSPTSLSNVFDLIGRSKIDSLEGMRVKLNQPIGKLIDQTRNLANVSDSLDGAWDLWAPLTEDHIFNLLAESDSTYEERFGLLFTLYVSTLCRLWDPYLQSSVDESDWDPVLEGGSARVGMQFALEQLREDARNNVSVQDVLKRVFTNHVLLQHERVATAKFPQDTFRFRREGERVRFFDKPIVYRRNNSRFNALSTTCSELGWSGFLGDANHSLSQEGQKLRKNGDLEMESRRRS